MRPELACSVLRSRVVLLAEARIGAELNAAQERGEVAKRGEQDRVWDNARASGIMPPAPLAARGCALAGSPLPP